MKYEIQSRNLYPKYRFSVLYTFFCILAAVFFMFYPAGSAAVDKIPFFPGEKLTFDLKWSYFKAGEAVLEVKPMKEIDGEKVYHFVLKAWSMPFIDVFYKVRDKIDAYANIEMTHSMLYKKKQKEGSTERDVVVTFDWENQKARYTNFDKTREPTSILAGSFDPLSILYYARMIDLKKGEVVERPVTDGKKSVIGKAEVTRKDWIEYRGKKVEAFLLEPELKDVGGVFEKSENAKLQVWITADERRLPILVKSKVVVGHFIARLTSATGYHKE